MARKSGKNKGYTYTKTESGTIRCRAYRDMPDGTRKQVSGTGKTEEAARKKLEQNYSKKLKNNEKSKKQTKLYTLESWFTKWLYEIKKPKFDSEESDTTGWYTRLSRKFLPIIGKKQIKTLKISDIQQVVNNMLENNDDPKYIKEVVCLLSTFLSYAHTEGYMPKLDFSKVDKPKCRKKKKVIYSESENAILSNYFSSDDFSIKYLPIKVMYDIGLRPEEVGGLNVRRY